MPDPAADTAGVLAWPPLIFAGPLIAGLGLQQVRPIRLPSRPSRPVSVVAIGLAGAMMVWAIRELRRAGTDVSPYQPTTAIVTAGPYRFSRNPIYLSLALLSAGIAESPAPAGRSPSCRSRSRRSNAASSSTRSGTSIGRSRRSTGGIGRGFGIGSEIRYKRSGYDSGADRLVAVIRAMPALTDG
ncbi:MAG TPA: methyltransferase [Dehalococcoidia bacterium]|nr:methyltransferase [Dehalococcoidia bacterium]